MTTSNDSDQRFGLLKDWGDGFKKLFISSILRLGYNSSIQIVQSDGSRSTVSLTELAILDGATVTTAELNILDDVCGSIDIALAASATTDGMDITVTVQDAAGTAIDAVHELEVWVSEDAQGEGLTGDTASGDLTWGTGTELQEIVSKKHYKVLTDVNGVAEATLVDSANPADQYIAVRHPVSGKVIVSAASGTSWEGA